MGLIEPVPYKQDTGKILIGEEFAKAAETVTPIWEIKQKYCAAQTENSKYRPGRRGR